MKWPWLHTKEEKPKELPEKIIESANKGVFGALPNITKKERVVLNEEERIEVCRLAATYESGASISKWLLEEKGKSITQQSISQMLRNNKWKALTEQFRVQFAQGIMEEPLSNKRYRLKYLHKFMIKSEEKGDIKNAIDAIDSAREEMEPRKGDFNLQLNQFNMISDEELLEIRNRLEEKLKVIEVRKPKEVENV